LSDNLTNTSLLCVKQPDRRQQKLPVANERRSGIDRRITPRYIEQINQDIYAPFIRHDAVEATPLSILPPIDKVEEISDCVKEKNYPKAVGIVLLLANSFKKDIDELIGAEKDISTIFRTKKPLYEDHQIPHSFTKGTFIEKLDKRFFFSKFDKTLYDTHIGQFILNKIGMIDYDKVLSGLNNKSKAHIYKIKVLGTKSAEIIGRTFLRIPILGGVTMFLLDIPQINKENNHKKQILKSTISISMITFGGAFLGAVGAYYPPLGLIGAGIGALLGNIIAKKINNEL